MRQLLRPGLVPRNGDDPHYFKVGKKAAGRTLDGKLHDEFPFFHKYGSQPDDISSETGKPFFPNIDPDVFKEKL